jgi:hypothetical protein
MIFVAFAPPLTKRPAPKKGSMKTSAILTDPHFLVPLIVFCIGLALLIALH